MSEKIYVVTIGSNYDEDKRVLGVFSLRGTAVKLAKEFEEENGWFEEFVLDDPNLLSMIGVLRQD